MVPVRERLVRAYPTELLTNLTLRELRSKYKRSALGWTWSVLNPAVTLAVYSVVFAVFLRVEPPVGDPSGLDIYAFFLVCGLVPWNFLAQGLSAAVSSLTANEGLIKKVYFPRSVLPTAAVLAWLATHGVELAVLALALIVAGNMVLPWLVPLVAVTALLTLFVLGLGMILAPVNVYFRDVEHFTAIFLNLWFWLTPILYPLSLLDDREILGVAIRPIFELNPMAQFVGAYRDLLYDLTWPGAGRWLFLVGVTATALVLGAVVFRRLEPRLAEEL